MDIEIVKKMLGKDKYALLSGIKLDHVGEGFATASVVINENHYNGANIVQGGLYFTLADYAFAAAANSRANDGDVAVAVKSDITFLKPVVSGKLIATAKEISNGKNISHYTVCVTNEKGYLVAIYNGTAYKTLYKGEPIK